MLFNSEYNRRDLSAYIDTSQGIVIPPISPSFKLFSWPEVHRVGGGDPLILVLGHGGAHAFSRPLLPPELPLRSDHRGTAHGEVAMNESLLAAGITPIVCVGESLAQREAGNTMSVVKGQLAAVVHAVGHHLWR